MQLATEEDHVPGQPDHPQIRRTIMRLLDGDQSWVRLNPDAAYEVDLTGQATERFPNNPANQNTPYTAITPWLSPESSTGVQRADQREAQNEMAGRVPFCDWSLHLTDVLHPVMHRFFRVMGPAF